jgi:hypothetical protein
VAVFACIAGQYVILNLASRIRSVVAANTVCRVIGVIKGCRYPAVGRMADIAVVAACHMRRILANSDGIVVTR